MADKKSEDTKDPKATEEKGPEDGELSEDEMDKVAGGTGVVEVAKIPKGKPDVGAGLAGLLGIRK